MWCTGLAALWHVQLFGPGIEPVVPCIGGRILDHWTTREVQLFLSFNWNINWEELQSDITPTSFFFIIHTLDCRLNTNIDQKPKNPRHFLSIQSRPICLSTLHFYVLASPLTKINT